MHSLRLRLLVLLSLVLGLAWLAAAWFTHLESREEINRLFDAHLSQSAQVLLATTRHDIQERVEHGEEGLLAVFGIARPGGQAFGVEDFEELEVEVAAVDDPRHGQTAKRLSEKRPRW